MSLIVVNHLVHDCMIDSGASTSNFPKKKAYVLGLEYNPMSKGLLQLDGSAVTTLEVIKDLALTLHACPSLAITQDVSIIELPPLFSIFLSRDFTAKVGGYLSSYWSHMLLRTRYDTRFIIQAEPIFSYHVESYEPSPLQSNCLI